jgi:hemerythrin-like domain-containing protein
MDPKSSMPNLAKDLERIHKVITRGLTIGVTRGADFIREGFPDSNLQQGYALYIQAFTSVITAHHLGEDEVSFPVLKIKLPTAPINRLSADHVLIETTLSQIKSTLPVLNGTNPAKALVIIVDGLKNILSIWKPHIDKEESSFSSEAIGRVMTLDEQGLLSARLGKHSQEHVGAPFFAIPFVLYNLNPMDRAEMAALLPKELTEVLIPGEWKEKWAPMKPFLLE